MSLGSISRPKRISDAQFVGDLMGLFKRNRIDSGDAAANFELCFATKDSFRSQLFTLCTAISHMSDEDLSGEQLLVLIGRALGISEAADGSVELPDSMRSVFLSGYQAWSNRDLNEPAPWPPQREAVANEPIPFPQPAEGIAKPVASEKHAPEAPAPGMRTVQEALLMARKQAPFELPPRSVPAPAATPAPPETPVATPAPTPAAAPSVNIEELTITELTKLLDDIEQRMSRIKPHFQELNALAHPVEALFERASRSHEAGEAPYPKAMVPAAQLGPSLVASPNSVSLSPIETAPIAAPHQYMPVEVPQHQEDAFLARHTYLKPGRRLPPDTIVPIPFATPPPVPVVELIRAELPAKPAETTTEPVGENPGRFRINIQLAIGIAAALILVASPLAGYVAYKLLHPTYVIEYQDLKPPPQSSDTAPPASNPAPEPPAAAPAIAPAQKASPKASSAAGSSKAHSAPKPHTAPPTPPAAVWPPAPQAPAPQR